MKFNIYKASVIYGGGTSAPNFYLLHEKVDGSFVKGFFADKQLDERFRTKEDSMGCYYAYKVEVVSL